MKIDEMILVIDSLPDREYPQRQLSLAVDVADKSEKSGVDSLFLNKKAEEICLESISIYEFVLFLKRDAFCIF